MFIENLNEWLKLVKWRKTDLANNTGIPLESISRWNQTDKFYPGLRSLRKIRDALNAELKRQGKPFEVTIDKLISNGN